MAGVSANHQSCVGMAQALASNLVDLVLVPEVSQSQCITKTAHSPPHNAQQSSIAHLLVRQRLQVTIDSLEDIYHYVDATLERKGHMVIVVAEGAMQASSPERQMPPRVRHVSMRHELLLRPVPARRNMLRRARRTRRDTRSMALRCPCPIPWRPDLP